MSELTPDQRRERWQGEVARNEHFHAALVQLVLEAQGAHVEIAGWLGAALGEVADRLPRKTESLLAQRPGSWEAALVRQLVNGTIGWPE